MKTFSLLVTHLIRIKENRQSTEIKKQSYTKFKGLLQTMFHALTLTVWVHRLFCSNSILQYVQKLSAKKISSKLPHQIRKIARTNLA